MTDPCKHCGTYCNYPASSEVVSMVTINKLRERYKDTKTGIMDAQICEYCGSVSIRWVDEKIKCNYCGELI